MGKVQRAVQYRYLDRERVPSTQTTLEQLVRNALTQKRKGKIIGSVARARIADLAQEGQLTLWNGMKGRDGGPLSGELLLYKQGFNQTAIEERLDKDDARFKLVTFQTDGKSKPVEGALYFSIIQDHVAIIQSNAVNGRWLERYLTWLLKDITEILSGEDIISLNSRTSFDKKDLQKFGPANQLVVHAKPSVREAENRELKGKAKGKGGTVLEVLSLLGVGKDAIDSIRKDIPEEGKLEGDFLVYIKEKNRKRPISVGTLDHAFRNAEPGEIDVQRRGSNVKSNLQSLTEPVRLTETVHGLDPDEAMDETVNVLYKWLERGFIHFDADP